ncbi:hypothetical protein QRX50_31695 [Amycolatopsis carbonis]|uniref:Uncharacterized protein n=1 Tax=Amycolatopsis carbonis TaxID=715471 RepID=A0A9Y2IAJ4_9PSEU|nr:hypothetical protein [Amycolatopsis sp. 2-15]WIX76024.1 hypothetical protein QRX50_31695 [Amycolatopsis sp. 2-15]
MTTGVFDIAVYTSSGLLAAGVTWQTLAKAGRFFRRVNTVVTQWLGDKDLEIPGMLDRMDVHERRLEDIEDQLKPKGGRTLRERLDIVERDVTRIKKAVRADDSEGEGAD